MNEPAADATSPLPFPPPLDRLAGREFSFYPSIENVPENLWTLREANWSEFLVENRSDASQIWVPRRYLGEVSSTDRPVMIVGLNRQLEFKAGQVWPVAKRVIPMPRVPSGEPAPVAESSGRGSSGKVNPADTMLGAAIRLDSSEKKVGRLILIALGVIAFVSTIALLLLRNDRSPDALVFKGVVQQSLGLSPEDDYLGVINKLGNPTEERFRAAGENSYYRLLAYKDRNVNVILAGREENTMRYVGAVDNDWKVIDSVTLKGGSNTYLLLSRMTRF
jgi:hypothetical protein